MVSCCDIDPATLAPAVLASWDNSHQVFMSGLMDYTAPENVAKVMWGLAYKHNKRPSIQYAYNFNSGNGFNSSPLP